MTTLANTNMRELYFENKTLTFIMGEPIFASLHQILLQLKADTNSIPTTLGGGDHGCVGIIVYPPTYAILAPMTPFLTPAHLGPLMISLSAT